MVGNIDTSCVIAVLDTGINAQDMPDGSYLPEIAFHPETALPYALKTHGTDVCRTILKNAPGAMVQPVQVTNAYGQLNTPSLEAALAWVLQQHARMYIKVVCAAFADYTDQVTDAGFEGSNIKKQIALLKEQGVIVVAAAGNWQDSFKEKASQGMAWPAILSEVVSVGALDDKGRIAGYSQRLNNAGGTGCATKVFTLPGAPGDTSGATAVVAGTWARLCMEHPGFAMPELMKVFEDRLCSMEDDEGKVWPVLSR